MALLGNNNQAVIRKAEKASQQQADFAYSLARKKAKQALDGITKQSIGLGNVNNTSDAAKPISSATQAALNGKAASAHQHAISDVVGLPDALNGLSDATASKASIAALSTIATDAAATYLPSVTNSIVFHTGTLTAARALTIQTTAVKTGSTIRFIRTGSGAFTLSVGGLKNLSTNTWCDVVYNGSAWQLTAYGTL